MLLNLSHNYSDKKEIIDREVGKAFTLAQRKELNGTGYSNIKITAASLDIYNLLVLNGKENHCSIKMRSRGLIISFKCDQETYALLIPHYKLKVYKGRAEEYSFYKDHYFIKIWAGAKDPQIHTFIKKIIQNKADNAPTQVEDLL